MDFGGKQGAIRLGWLVGISALAATARAETSYEFVAHSAENYGSSGYCSGDPLTNANEDATYVDNGIVFYNQKEFFTNLLFDGRDITDQVNFSWGVDENDPNGSDFADIIFISGHSAGSCTAGSERSWINPGDNADGCAIYLSHKTSSSRHMTLGGATEGRDANAMIIYGCLTTLYCAYTAGSYDALSRSDGQFNLLNGFHGDVAEVSGYQSDLSEYSIDVVYDSMGDAWLDWMYWPDIGNGEDNCPSSIGWGANTSEMDDFFNNAAWTSLPNNGSRTTDKFYRICGCDPHNGAALPGC
jgi:hypothetical protein